MEDYMDPMLFTKREKRKLAGQFLDLCLTCGTCAGGCPVTGVDGLDMRKALRLVVLGMGKAAFTAYTCDLSFDYVKINASYRS